MEWIDYRRDVGLWPFLLVPPLLSVAWAYGGMIGLGIVVAFGAGMAVLALIIALCGVGLWIVGNAAVDALRVFAAGASSFKENRRRTTATTR